MPESLSNTQRALKWEFLTEKKRQNWVQKSENFKELIFGMFVVP